MSHNPETKPVKPEDREPDDTMLMAFADEALPPETAAALAPRIAADPQLSTKVARFKADRALLRAAFDPVLEEPVPDRLVAAIRARAAAEPASPAPARRPALRAIEGGEGPGSAPPAPVATTRPIALRRRGLPLALAASLALLLGFTVGRLVPSSEPPAPTLSLAALVESEPVRALAEQGTSGESVALAGGATVLLLGTLERGPGRYCRELEVSGGPQPGLAILCRSAEGTWPVTALVALVPAEAPSGFAPAGGEIEHDPAEALREAVGSLRLLDREAEAAARARGWR